MKDHPDYEFIQMLWRKHWERHQRYLTLCLPCISLQKEKERNARLTGDALAIELEKAGSVTSEGNHESTAVAWDVAHLKGASKQILSRFHAMAKESLFGEQGRRRTASIIDASDDENAVARPSITVSASSKYIAINWLKTARIKLQQHG